MKIGQNTISLNWQFSEEETQAKLSREFSKRIEMNVVWKFKSDNNKMLSLINNYDNCKTMNVWLKHKI